MNADSRKFRFSKFLAVMGWLLAVASNSEAAVTYNFSFAPTEGWVYYTSTEFDFPSDASDSWTLPEMPATSIPWISWDSGISLSGSGSISGAINVGTPLSPGYSPGALRMDGYTLSIGTKDGLIDEVPLIGNTVPIQTIPEPHPLLLGGLSVCGLFLRRRNASWSSEPNPH
jgi:hypothetical protein